MPFDDIYIDVSGHCNAKCRWCVTFNERHISAARGFLNPALFSDILRRLRDIGSITSSTHINLHNWGEPTLNKDFPALIGVLAKEGLRWSFSTNASLFPSIERCDLALLQHLTISMPGFSQKSYDYIHGFNFQSIVKNIEKYARLLQGNSRKITIAYHVYQFNISEIEMAKSFSSNIQVAFSPSYAYFNNIDLGLKYISKNLPETDIYDASKQLSLFYVDDLFATFPKDYACPQLSMLTLDEFGNVLQCCGIARTQPHYTIGSIFDLDDSAISRSRNGSPACISCLQSGLAYWIHNPKLYQTIKKGPKNDRIQSKFKKCIKRLLGNNS